MGTGPPPLVSRKATRAFSFGGHTLNLTDGSLRRGDLEVKLRPKSFEALRYLVENAGRLVPKAELIAVLWPDTAAVSEDSLTHCVMDVRRALGDTAQEIVRTVPGRGYLFTAAVHNCDQPVKVICESDVRPASRSGLDWEASRLPAIVAALMLMAAAAGFWLWKVHADRNRARAAVARVEELAAAGKYLEGYELALQVLDRLPAESRVISLITELSDDLSVTTRPSGAEVFLRRLGSAREESAGVTPIEHRRIPRGEYILSIRKTGYAVFERTLSSALDRVIVLNKKPWEIRIEQDLRERSKVPRDMAFVPGGEYRLRANSRPTNGSVKIGDFFIDKYEASNRDFKAFIDAGGYRNREFWDRAAFDRSGFKDTTGLAGPRGWIGGTFPAGQEQYPVTGISWPEARAYCRFRGKDLPTLFQWEKAARPPVWPAFGVVSPWGLLDGKDVGMRVNVESPAPAPVDSFPFGMSPFGVYNMAGNISEWIQNRFDDGYTVAGGGWNEPLYRFLYYGPRPLLYSSDNLGCRCSVSASPEAAGEEAMPFSSNAEVPHYPISTEKEFRASAARYAYEPRPLNIAVIGVAETASWHREEVAFDGQGGQRAKAYLYLPKSAAPPYQTIHYLSGNAWWQGIPVTEVVEGRGARLAPYLRSGRAIFLVVLEGFAGRETGKYANLEIGSAEWGPAVVNWVIDMRRGVDYLATRSDIDARRIAFWNDSTNQVGTMLAAVEERYSSVIFIGGGAHPLLNHLPTEINPLHFAPHIRPPKLMLNGIYDDMKPQRTSVEPFFQLLREPKKRLNFDGGHMPTPAVAVPIINPFLDETLGPVKR
jgi:formylglycine-generating enzyme required for sulfatase activity/DNA-binding winged helix-turn-helix (wHTH) protein